jgi:flagellar hook-length control protein FliK
MIPDLRLQGLLSSVPAARLTSADERADLRRPEQEDETRRLQRMMEFERWMRRALEKKEEAEGVVAYGQGVALLPVMVPPSTGSTSDYAATAISTQSGQQQSAQPSFDWNVWNRQQNTNAATELDASALVTAPVRLPYVPEVIDDTGQDDANTLRIPAQLFPEIASGHITQAVEQQVPVTRLDFMLTPPEYGYVQLQVSLQAGQVHVQVQTASIQATSNLEQFVPRIREILGEYHLTPGSVQVITGVAAKSGAGGASGKGEQGAFGFAGTNRRRRGDYDDPGVITT